MASSAVSYWSQIKHKTGCPLDVILNHQFMSNIDAFSEKTLSLSLSYGASLKLAFFELSFCVNVFGIQLNQYEA